MIINVEHIGFKINKMAHCKRVQLSNSLIWNKRIEFQILNDLAEEEFIQIEKQRLVSFCLPAVQERRHLLSTHD